MRERILGVAKYKTKRQMTLFKNGRRMGPQRFANLRGCCSWKMRATFENLAYKQLQKRMRLLCF